MSASLPADNPLWAVRARLEELALLGEKICAAIRQRDESGACDLLHRSRSIRSLLGEAQTAAREASPPSGSDGQRLALELKALSECVRIADSAVDQWIANSRAELVGKSARLTDPEWIADWIKVVVPRSWSWRNDLFVIVGDQSSPAIAELQRLGQRRIVAIRGEAAPDAPTPAVTAHTLSEARAAIRNFYPLPSAVAIRRLGSGVPDSDQAIEQCIDEGFGDARVYRHAGAIFAETWIQQGLANLAEIARWPSAYDLEGAFRGKPAIIVSAGPSLNRNVHLLSSLRGNAIIIAVAQSLAALRTVDVSPDVVVVADPQDVRYLFDSMPADKIGTLALAASVHPGLFRLGMKRFISFSDSSPYDSWIFRAICRVTQLTGGGSVAHSALRLAHVWGCDPILFIGQDLAFTDGRAYYSESLDGSLDVAVAEDGTYTVRGWNAPIRNLAEQQGILLDDPASTMWLRGLSGGKVPTSPTYFRFHQWFESAAKLLTGQARLLNCTEGGAWIDGMEHLPLLDAAAQIANRPFNPAAVFDRAIARHSRRQVTDRLLLLLQDHHAVISRIAIKAREGSISVEEALSSDLLRLLEPNEFDAAKDRLEGAADPAERVEAHRRLAQLVTSTADRVLPWITAAERALKGSPVVRD